MYNKVLSGKASIAVIGLGYVGLPLALEFSKTCRVIGYDIKKEHIESLKNNIDPNNEINSNVLFNSHITFTSNATMLNEIDLYIIAVPTPVDYHNIPDLQALFNATNTVASYLKRGNFIVYESTVFPHCIEDECVPIIENKSMLEYKRDFKVAYSPSRVNPGDNEHYFTKIKKVVGACDNKTLNDITKIYETIIEAGVYPVDSIAIAEATKMVENIQRDMNIALINEFSTVFNRMKIDTQKVLDACRTKWNFLDFKPGLVGGFCNGTDAYYMSYKAKEYDYHTRVFKAGRPINDEMGFYIANQTVKQLLNMNKIIQQCKVLVMGITYKENVSDIKNSRAVDIINELKSYMIEVDIVDPYADNDIVKLEYGFFLNEQIENEYDAVIIAVNHEGYRNLDEKYFQSICHKEALIFDVKGIYQDKIKHLNYWTL